MFDPNSGLSLSQFHQQSSRSDAAVSACTPQQRVWQAVIIQAIREVYSMKLAEFETGVKIPAAVDAEDWLLSDSVDFRAVCSAAGWNHAYVRTGVIKMLTERHPEIPHPDLNLPEETRRKPGLTVLRDIHEQTEKQKIAEAKLKKLGLLCCHQGR